MYTLYDINRLRIVFILFIARTTPLIVGTFLPFPSVQDAVAGVPAMPVIPWISAYDCFLKVTPSLILY
jgi:hypothetical protein